jgi:hypothetical protein
VERGPCPCDGRTKWLAPLSVSVASGAGTGWLHGGRRDERRWHSALQLEVAALAARDGFTVALEAAAPAPTRPSDVTLVQDGRELRVETFLLLPDEGTQEATAFWDKFSHDTIWIGGEVQRRNQR